MALMDVGFSFIKIVKAINKIRLDTILNRLDQAINSVKDDIGGAQYEIGLGANFNVTPNSYIYADLERTNGGDVVENWRYNLGVRYVF